MSLSVSAVAASFPASPYGPVLWPPPVQRCRGCVLGAAGVGGAVSGGAVLLLAAVSEFIRGELTACLPGHPR